MRKVKYYIETVGLTTLEDGSPDLTSICLAFELKPSAKELPYPEMIKGLNALGILQELGVLRDTFFAELKDARFITPEEYETKYGADEDEEE